MSEKSLFYLITIVGIMLVITGSWSRGKMGAGKDMKCKPQPATWGAIVMGAGLALLGAGNLWQMHKAGGVGAMAAPPPDMGGAMGAM